MKASGPVQQRISESPDAEPLLEEVSNRLEEAWGLVTECLVMRDGLLEACKEVEQTMIGIQQRLGALSLGLERDDENDPRGS
jgi:hypothetical protein